MGSKKSSRHPSKPTKARTLKESLKGQGFSTLDPKSGLKAGRVLANFGIACLALVEGQEMRLANRRQLPQVVPGDWIQTDGIAVDAVATRKNNLARFVERHGVRVLAANVDSLVLVCSASTPIFRPGLVGRYLLYARISRIPFVLLVNKMDEAEDWIEDELKIFEESGVKVLRCSAMTGEGFDAVDELVRSGDCVFSGHSGVGKTTIINRYFPEMELITQETSESTGKGRHTTTVSEAFVLGEQLLIDTPGIREFGFIGIDPRDVILGFPDLQPFAQNCEFDDCLHVDDQGCGVIEALEKGEIDEERYLAYLRLLETINQ